MEYLLPAFREKFPGSTLFLGNSLEELIKSGSAGQVEVAVCWQPPREQLVRLPALRMVQSVGAGVDHIDTSAVASEVPIFRIIDPEMSHGMAAFVCWAVVHRQRFMDRYIVHSSDKRWQEEPIISPRRHSVGIAGLGSLGQSCAKALLAMGYDVSGWSRSVKPKLPSGLRPFVGESQKTEFLSNCNTLVCLLPLTEATRGFLNIDLMRQLPRGACVVNVGRGGHLVEIDLLQALNDGQVGAAVLDTFSIEPLPPEHPFWDDKRILITPHIATRTDPKVIALQTDSNFLALATASPRPGAVDIGRGY